MTSLKIRSLDIFTDLACLFVVVGAGLSREIGWPAKLWVSVVCMGVVLGPPPLGSVEY